MKNHQKYMGHYTLFSGKGQREKGDRKPGGLSLFFPLENAIMQAGKKSSFPP
jgi:hypothetical protein